MATAKQVALEIVGSLTDDCTLKDAAYRPYLRQLVEEAREDFREGRIFTQEEVEREASRWLEPQSGPAGRRRTCVWLSSTFARTRRRAPRPS